MKFPIPYLLILLVFIGCKEKTSETLSVKSQQKEQRLAIIDSSKSTILTRFSPPEGFTRKSVDPESFAAYLRNFSLLNIKEQVHLHDGSLKNDQTIHASILDVDVGKKDLQQCADAVMRLRAEYLYAQKRYDDIAFDFTNGWRFAYRKWRAGNDLVVSGNRTKWKEGSTPKESYTDFRKYLNQVFMYAGTLSLSKELKRKELENIEIGDVFIVGGSPGHAVLVVDIAENDSTRDKAFMLAQSYMPAQQIHVLKNLSNTRLSPWYFMSEIESEIQTPEWTFRVEHLKGF